MRTLISLLLLLAPVPGISSPAPADDGAYFQGLDHALKERGTGHAVAVLDLDHLDRNLETLSAHFKGPLKFRVVEKSLPSVELLRYVLEKTHSNRVMAFHHPFLRTLLAELPPDTEFLFGKTIPTSGVREIIAGMDLAHVSDVLRRVTWLVDTKRTLDELVGVFAGLQLPVRISVEIDVGLHRGGAARPPELEELLTAVRAAGGRVLFTGFMGYDGHVPHVPAPALFSLKEWAVRSSLAKVEARYAEFIAYLKERFPDLHKSATIFNGGGSRTYSLYGPGSVVTDISAGSAALKPRDFDFFTLENHVPALYLATPVLKRYERATIPFIDGLPFLFSGAAGFYVFGGGWSEQVVYPGGVQDHGLTRATPNRNLVANQTFLYGPATTPLKPGDFVFYRPNEGDAIFLFEEILLYRGGKIVGAWKPIAKRL